MDNEVCAHVYAGLNIHPVAEFQFAIRDGMPMEDSINTFDCVFRFRAEVFPGPDAPLQIIIAELIKVCPVTGWVISVNNAVFTATGRSDFDTYWHTLNLCKPMIPTVSWCASNPVSTVLNPHQAIFTVLVFQS